MAVDLDGLEELDHRILLQIEKNISEFNVNMTFAPSKFQGEKTRVKGGRKWNARWSYSEINKLDPTFWSDANKVKIANGELPTVDDHYLNKIGKGLSDVELPSKIGHEVRY